jgi:hypothetical protein
MRSKSRMKRGLLFLLLGLTLGSAALAGITTQSSSGVIGFGASVVRADDCDGQHGPPSGDCPANPTPTPTPTDLPG